MEEFKLRVLQNLLSRNPTITLERCLEEMKGLELRARSCYSEVIDMSSEEFVEMMLLDGCFTVFILTCKLNELVWMPREGLQETEHNVDGGGIAHGVSLSDDVMYDLLLLENQIPFFVLEALFNLESSSKGQDKLEPQIWIPTVTQMKEAGVKFKVKNSTSSFLDVTFRDGVLEIPTLVLYDSSKSILPNLIAYEQCYRYTKFHVTNYTHFMDCLVNSPADVAILQDEKIIMNSLSGENEAAQFINQLGIEVFIDWNESYLSDLFNEVNRFCGLRRNKWRAKLVRDYFSNPWTIISLGAAVVLLVLTFLQTFFAMYTYFHPSS
ncbi:UPF0481 protein [Acorus gramineus]|uniref:UPF0481 protein n=1 Tax=Acorus gramineus TaxID=55184 RepID=A0AAV9ALW6_ACOGR|nr:UPF0481 protein [Acorus gramineus]